MQGNKNSLGLLEQMQKDILELQEEVRILKNQQIKDDFDIWTYNEAIKIVGCCRQTLQKAIKNKTLKNGIDYKTNGKKYLFSLSSLKEIKGTL
jgi:aspartyl/asparaginyl-tRNA synthetase